MPSDSSVSEQPPVNIICMKWGQKYGAEYANRLYRMVDRNITRPFRFICFTDDASGLLEGIEAQPLPSLELPPGTPERGWNKLSTLAEGFGGLEGEALFLDLDVVIVGNIDELFDHPGEFLIIRDKKFKKRLIGNSSVYRFKIGRYDQSLRKFQQNFDQVKNSFRNEQAYLSDEVHQRGELGFWPPEWCVSFKYDCVAPWPMGYFKTPQAPAGSKILIFHGHPLPDEAIDGVTHKWYRPIRPCPWLKDYWK